MEWVELIRAKGARVAHPRGGRQPHDKGFAAAHRVLGISRRDLGRAERLANICFDAQAIVREAKLDDLLTALEEIAEEPPQRQVEKALELKERYRKPRRDRATDAATSANTGAQTDQVPEPEAPSLAPNEDESDQVEDDAVESPATAPAEISGDVDQPSAVQGGAGHYEKYEIIKARWDEYFARDSGPLFGRRMAACIREGPAALHQGGVRPFRADGRQKPLSSLNGATRTRSRSEGTRSPRDDRFCTSPPAYRAGFTVAPSRMSASITG